MSTATNHPSPHVDDALFEVLGDLILELSPDGVVLSVRGAESILQGAPAPLHGRALGEILPAGAAERILAAVSRLVTGGGLEQLELRVAAAGEPRRVEARLARTGGGHVLAMLRDITKRKSAEDRFRHTEERFSLLLDSLKDCAIFMLDSDGRVASWNSGAERVKGYPAPEILRSHFSRFYPPEDVTSGMPSRDLEEAAVAGHYQGEGWRVRKDGSRFWADVSITALPDSESTLRGFAAVIRDVNDRRAADQKLLESEERFRTMADHAPVLLWMAGIDSLCNFFNRGWLEFTGRPMEMEVGTGWAEGVYFEEFQNCMNIYLTSFRARRAFRTEYRLRRADGEYRWVLDQGVPRFAPDGTFLGFIGSCIDVTEMKEAHDAQEKLSRQLEERVVQRTAELATALAEKELLLKEIHHRVKNNLQMISSLLNLQGYRTGPEVAEVFDEMRARVASIALFHEKVYQGADLASVGVGDYVRDLAGMLFDQYSAGGRVDLTVDAGDVRLGVNQAIPCGLILNELITNAFKYAFPGGRRGTIRVGIRRDEGDADVELTVADDGVGMPEGLDIHHTSTLGMELVVTLAQQLNGTIELKQDGGTCVQVRFSAPNPLKSTRDS